VIVFEVRLARGTSDEDLLSAEVLQETQAQVMTAEQGKALGFSGFSDDPDLRLIAVTAKDERWIEKALERAPNVTGYRAHHVDR